MIRLADLAGSDVILLGAGLETLSVLPHLRAAGVERIRVVEAGTISPERLATLRDNHVDAEAILPEIPDADAPVVLRSPGFPHHRADVEELYKRARLATTPTGLWLAIRGGARTIAVTGTKGKSSTATLIAQGLESVGLAHELVGNIGTVAWSVDPLTDAVVVAELSSYHGADLVCTGEIAVLTLLAQDHLDWHGGVQMYHHDKLRVLELDQGDGRLVVHRFALAGTPLPDPLASLIEWVHAPAGADHRLRNVALAVAAVRAETALRDIDTPDADELTAALAATYPDLPGRFHTVPSRDGVTWIDDALGSNPSATAAALEHLAPGPAVLICGGHDRDAALDPVFAALDAWPDASLEVVWLGAGDDHRLVQLARHPAVGDQHLAVSMPDAVATARSAAPSGSTVVFSPMAPTERVEGTWADRSAAFRTAVVDAP